MDKFLYFRTVVDADNDDGAAGSNNDTSLCVPTKNIVGMAPASDTTLKISFKTLANSPGFAGGTGEEIINDFVTLTVNAHTHKVVMDEIIRAINSNHLYNDGFIVVADTVTTNVANETVEKVFLHPDITGFNGYTDDTNATGITVAGSLS